MFLSENKPRKAAFFAGIIAATLPQAMVLFTLYCTHKYSSRAFKQEDRGNLEKLKVRGG